jgi:hypothetical protein
MDVEYMDTLLEQSARMHRHLCPRQVLGVRMGLLAGSILGLDLPQTGKRLITIVETDGCAADAISVATNCWVGRRTLRVEDHGTLQDGWPENTSPRRRTNGRLTCLVTGRFLRGSSLRSNPSCSKIRSIGSSADRAYGSIVKHAAKKLLMSVSLLSTTAFYAGLAQARVTTLSLWKNLPEQRDYLSMEDDQTEEKNR